MLHEIVYAENKTFAGEAVDAFAAESGTKWPKAVEKITKDRGVLLTFYDFPAEPWKHLRTCNAIESPSHP